VLGGEKVHVLDGHVADHLARVRAHRRRDGAAEGITLFLIPRDTAGVTSERMARIDARNAAIVELEGRPRRREAVVGDGRSGRCVLGRVLDRATIALTAEMLGGMLAAFDMTSTI
jgi:alkylation response protein AidB-like acyl-CoA dehydrogenase